MKLEEYLEKIQYIRKQIDEDELYRAIENLKELLELLEFNQEWQDEAIQLSSRRHATQKQIDDSVISQKDGNFDLNRIKKALLALLRDIEKDIIQRKIQEYEKKLADATVKICDPYDVNCQLGTGFFYAKNKLICTFQTVHRLDDGKKKIKIIKGGESYEASGFYFDAKNDFAYYEIDNQDFFDDDFLLMELNPQLPEENTKKPSNNEMYKCFSFYGFPKTARKGVSFRYHYDKKERLESKRMGWKLLPFNPQNKGAELPYINGAPVVSLATGKVYGILKEEKKSDGSILVIPIHHSMYNTDSDRLTLKDDATCKDILYECLIQSRDPRKLKIVLEAIEKAKAISNFKNEREENEEEKIPLPCLNKQKPVQCEKDDFIRALAQVMKGSNDRNSFVEKHNCLLVELCKQVNARCDDGESRFLLFYLISVFLKDGDQSGAFSKPFYKVIRGFTKVFETKDSTHYFIPSVVRHNKPNMLRILNKLLANDKIDPYLLWLVKERKNIKFSDLYFDPTSDQFHNNNCGNLPLRWSKWDDLHNHLVILSDLCNDLRQKEKYAREKGIILNSHSISEKLNEFIQKEEEINETVLKHLDLDNLVKGLEQQTSASQINDDYINNAHALLVNAITLIYQHKPSLVYRTVFS